MPRYFVIILICTFGCATVSGGKRVGFGAASGAAVGGFGGALLSPNDVSRGMNALVFGLTGALIGGVIALLSDPGPGEPPLDQSLKAREFSRSSVNREYLVEPQGTVPTFVKERLQPTVIEESVERDQVTEDGILHEPHKVYRIKRQAELFPNVSGSPADSTTNSQPYLPRKSEEKSK